MHFVAGILKPFGGSLGRRSAGPSQGAAIQDNVPRAVLQADPVSGDDENKKKKKKDVLGELSKSERDKEKKDRKKQQQTKRVPFNFEKDKEKVMQSIVEGSQASSNLVNAITLVNMKTDSLGKNERVQECLEEAKKANAHIVRYIRLVESEDIIGTLIETNDRIISSIEMYERLSVSGVDPDPESTELAKTMAATHLAQSAGANNVLLSSPFDNVNSANSTSKSTPHIHPDLEDLTFGPVKGGSTTNLPAPIKPSFHVLSDDDDNEDRLEQRGTLSDFSDYETSDEETHNANNGNARAGPSARRNYITVSGDEEEFTRVPLTKNNDTGDDPFADPFADELRR